MRALGFIAIATVASERLPPGSVPSGVPSSLISRPGVVLHSVHGSVPPSASSLASRTSIEKSSSLACVRGDLELRGDFQVYKPVDLGFCERIIAHNATVILSAPLRFRSTSTSLEFSGNLTLKGAKEGFACMVVKGEFVMTEGSFLSISGCKQNSNLLWGSDDGIDDSDVASGGGIRADYFRQMGGTILISNTVGARGGGAINALGGFRLLKGNLFINDAVAWNSGGAIKTNHFHQSGGNLTISNSSAHFNVHRGIGYEELHFHNDFGEDEEMDGEASAYYINKLTRNNRHDPEKKLVGGGAIFASVMNHSGGSITIEDAHIRAVQGPGEGGAICSNQFIISGSASLSIRHSHALALREGGSGGGLRVGSFQQLGGELIMEDSLASTDQMTPSHRGRMGAFGGCIFAESLEMLRGNMTLRWCRAEGNRMSHGGAIYVQKDVLQAGGNILIEHSYAHSIDVEGAGGAFYVTKVVTQQSGSLEIRNCSAKGPSGGNGGAMKAKCLNQYDPRDMLMPVIHDLTKEYLQQQILLEDCSAETLGGGLYLGFEVKEDDVYDRHNGLMQGEKGVMTIRGCSASSGGAIYSLGAIDTYGKMLMQDCMATEGSGGCLRSEDTAFLNNATFDRCYADQSAAAMQSYGLKVVANTLRNATFRHCYSGASRSIAVFDRVRLDSVTVVGNINASDPFERQEFVVLFDALSTKLTCNTNCAIQKNFGDIVNPVRAQNGAGHDYPQIHTLICPLGYGRHDDFTSVGCERCPLGRMQMDKALNGTCQACPSEAEICEATRMRIPRGMMVHPHDLTRAWHCPNHLACPGAVLETLPGKVEDHSQFVLQTMCQSGYTALGCVKCVESYGRLDNTPLSCTECSDSSWHTLGIFAFYILKDSWLLLVAAATAPSPDGSKPWSAVLMNQLMAFALLANILMSSLLQTTCIAHFSGVVRTFVDFSDLFLSFFSPSCGGAGNLGISVDCLLRQVEGSRSLRSSQSIMTGLPLLLMLIFGAVKVEPLLALIVGLNVFLPGCMAVFGSYFVAFRFSPYPSNLEMPFMPESNSGRFTLALCIISCFAVAIAFWSIVMIKREASPVPRYVVYLTQSFKPTYCVWEMERFVRKLCLALISTMIPATVSPALKMELVSVVLITSLALHSHFLPHKVESWNHLEIGLLSLSQFLTGVTGTLMVSDIYWSNEMTSGVLILMVLIIITLLTVICATLAGLLLWNLYHEGPVSTPSKDADEELPDD